MFHERCKTTIISLLYSSHSALNLVKFIKIAFFVINLCKKDCNSMMHTWQQTIDRSWKQPRPILQDRDHKSQHQERKIPVSRPRPRSRGLHLRKFAKHTNNVYFGIQQRFFSVSTAGSEVIAASLNRRFSNFADFADLSAGSLDRTRDLNNK